MDNINCLHTEKRRTSHFCEAYRNINYQTRPDSNPVPRMDECINSLGKATVFSTFDGNNGYWQVEIENEDQDKTEFASRHGLYCFVRKTFGLKNAPATFQSTTDVIPANVIWQLALAYLEDSALFSKTLVRHIVWFV